jgi:hypothetical protein
LLPYTGVGSGITRALDEDINVTFTNNDKAQEFVITVWRGESNQVEGESNQVGNQVEQKSNEVEEGSKSYGKQPEIQESKHKIRKLWIHYFYFSLHVSSSCSSMPSSWHSLICM